MVRDSGKFDRFKFKQLTSESKQNQNYFAAGSRFEKQIAKRMAKSGIHSTEIKSRKSQEISICVGSLQDGSIGCPQNQIEDFEISTFEPLQLNGQELENPQDNGSQKSITAVSQKKGKRKTKKLKSLARFELKVDKINAKGSAIRDINRQASLTVDKSVDVMRPSPKMAHKRPSEPTAAKLNLVLDLSAFGHAPPIQKGHRMVSIDLSRQRNQASMIDITNGSSFFKPNTFLGAKISNKSQESNAAFLGEPFIHDTYQIPARNSENSAAMNESNDDCVVIEFSPTNPRPSAVKKGSKTNLNKLETEDENTHSFDGRSHLNFEPKLGSNLRIIESKQSLSSANKIARVLDIQQRHGQFFYGLIENQKKDSVFVRNKINTESSYEHQLISDIIGQRHSCPEKANPIQRQPDEILSLPRVEMQPAKKIDAFRTGLNFKKKTMGSLSITGSVLAKRQKSQTKLSPSAFVLKSNSTVMAADEYESNPYINVSVQHSKLVLNVRSQVQATENNSTVKGTHTAVLGPQSQAQKMLSEPDSDEEGRKAESGS